MKHTKLTPRQSRLTYASYQVTRILGREKWRIWRVNQDLKRVQELLR
jgi:hypothetical protein